MYLQPTWISSVCIPRAFTYFGFSFRADSIAVGGADRPPSKRMQEQMKLDDQERRRAAREERIVGNQPQPQPQGSQEGYLSYMQRQVTDRTERLGLAGDHMDRLEENSSNWAQDVNKYVQNQKRKAVLGGRFLQTGCFVDLANGILALGSKFGF